MKERWPVAEFTVPVPIPWHAPAKAGTIFKDLPESARPGPSVFVRALRQTDARYSAVPTTKTSALETDPVESEANEPIRCIVADDHELVRYGIRRLLEDSHDFVVVAEAGDAASALKLAIEHHPDLVLLDIGMPGMSSFDAGLLMEQHCPKSRIVYLTMHEDREYIQQALRSGASGYLLKDTPTPLLLRALRGVRRGERSWSPQILAQLREEGSRRNGVPHVPLRRSVLTVREREVMKLLAEGRTVRQTASDLGVSIKTVEAHKFNLMRKLDIHNKAQLVTVAI
jgi:two-component system response regulator NreC